MIPELKWHARRTIRFLSAIFGVLCGVCTLGVLQPANATTFRLPLAADTTVHFYYDHDPTTSVRTWRCSTSTTESYDGHRGTDFSGGPRGEPIYAGAKGTVSFKIDGFGDGSPGSTDGGGFGNYVRLDHGNGLLTYYGHMTSGSVTATSVGLNVTCGEQVGGVGRSGSATGLHLHFEPRLNGVGFDPFSGDCSPTQTSWWVNQGTGSPAATCEGSPLEGLALPTLISPGEAINSAHTPIPYSSITFNWNKNNTGATYNLYVRDITGFADDVRTTSGTLVIDGLNVGDVSSYIWTGAQTNKKYRWQVDAVKTGSTSESGRFVFVTQGSTGSGGPSIADCVFDWAERVYQNLFAPEAAVSQTLAPYYYRYYAGTNAYLGTSSDDNKIYYLGPESGNTLLDVGPLSYWGTTAGCL